MKGLVEKVNTVYRTSRYELFKPLVGNRAVSDGRVAKIKESIATVGYVSSPIICNEKMEVIDGQGRLQALRELDLPVDYICVEGLTIRECIALNINQTNWRLIDYIESHASIGNNSYKRLLELVRRYPDFSIRPIGFACTGILNCEKAIKSGTFYLTQDCFDRASNDLDYAMKFVDILNNAPNVDGALRSYYTVLIFTHHLPGVDDDRLYQSVRRNVNMLISAQTNVLAARVLDSIYNKGLRADNKVYIETEFKKYEARRKEIERNADE